MNAQVKSPQAQAAAAVRRGRAKLLAVLFVVALIGATLVGALLAGPAKAASCPAGQVASVSKYAGNTCMAKPSKAGRNVAKVTSACGLGVAGGLQGILTGCLAGAVSIMTD